MVIALKGFNEEQVTVGNFWGGAPTRTTWTDPIPLADPGIPLHMYDPSLVDPLSIWKSQPAVRRVVGYAARQFASVSWHAYKRVSDTDRRRLQKSEAERKLNHPAKYRSGYNLMETLMVDRLLYDRWCLLFLPAARGGRSPARLLRVPPRLLDIQSNWLGEVTGIYILNPTAGEADIDITDAPMAVSWGWSAQVAGGISPMTTMREILTESRRGVQWRTMQWDTSPKMSGVLTHPKEYHDPVKRERFLQSWRSWRDTPGANAGTPILENGMEYKELKGITSRDAEDIAGRKLTDEEVATMLGFPPELLGIRESTFSNLLALRQMLFGPVLGPYFTEFQGAFNSGLVQALDATPKLYVEADRETAMAGSFLEQAQLLSTMVGGPVMTVAEGRARLNLPYLDGTDELITPLNVTQGGQASPRDSGSQNRKPNSDPEQETP